MTRLESNRKIISKISRFIESNPDLRFIQALWGLKIVDDTDRFNEESIETLNKIKVEDKIPCSSSVDELFLCKCSNSEHQLIFSYFLDEDEVYVSVHLVPKPFWERLVNGIKYIFGYRSKFGDFDEMILNPKDAEKLQSVTNHLRP